MSQHEPGLLTSLDHAAEQTTPTPAATLPRSSDPRIDRSPAPVTITREDAVHGVVADRLWQVYRENFEPLAELAIQTQALTEAEFLGLCANLDVVKIVAWKRGEPIGLGMITNALECIKELSIDFVTLRYPEHVANRTAYAGNIIMVDSAHRGMTLFSRIATEMWQIPARAGGILIFDMCEFNRSTFGVEDLTRQLAAPFPRSSVREIDRQTWYVAELPSPIGGR